MGCKKADKRSSFTRLARSTARSISSEKIPHKMALTIEIPQINITTEAEEDDDHAHYNIAEALTDTEDLMDDENLKQKTTTKKKSKLMIKLNDNSALTDLEDFEGSDDEKHVTIIKHDQPLDVDKALEDNAFEELHSNLEAKGTDVSSSNISRSHNKKYGLDFTDEIELNLPTDSENYDTESDVEDEDIPENTTNLELLKSDDFISDNTKQNNQHHSKHFVTESLNVRSVSPALSVKTDVENVNSETSDEEKVIKKQKRSRRRHRSSKRQSVTDVEELALSENDHIKKSLKKEKKKQTTLRKSISVPYDSEDEDEHEIPFPVTKKVFQKKQVHMRIPEFDTNILTETEDFGEQVDGDEEETHRNIDESAFDAKLDEMVCCYSQVKEEASIVNHLVALENEDLPAIDIQGEHTDIDDFHTDTEPEMDRLPREDSVQFNIKFSPSIPLFESSLSQPNSLLLPANTDDPVTDLENIDSSSDVSEHREMRLALLHQQYGTEIEDFESSSNDEDALNNEEEIELPPVVRNLMILEENGSINPTVRITPLPNDDEEELPKEHNPTTDEENISEVSEAEDALNYLDIERPNRAPTPDLPALEGGEISVVENMNKTNRIHDNDDHTDTEEIYVESKLKRKRAPKFKHMFEKSMSYKGSNSLAANADSNQALTDTEDLYFSDSKKDTLNVREINTDQGLTDTENLNMSADDKSVRVLTVTPEHMRELEGDTLLFKESSGPFSIIDRLEINRFTPNQITHPGTPLPTDTEEVFASADEESINYSRDNMATPNQIHEELDNMSSTKVQNEITRKFDEEAEVMYLKGGGFSDRLTDVEEFYNDTESEKCWVDKKKEQVELHLHTTSVSFSNKIEWDARKPTREAASLDSPAAQQGSQPSGSQPTASSQAEAEESQENIKDKDSKKVTDQHQLSDDMKELLKELEKETKQ